MPYLPHPFQERKIERIGKVRDGRKRQKREKIEETEGENEKAGKRTKNRVVMEEKVGSGKERRDRKGKGIKWERRKNKKAVEEKKLNRIEVNVEEKRIVDDRRWVKGRNATKGEKERACTNKMVFARGSPILALSLHINL